MNELRKAIDEELEDLGLCTDAEAFMWLVLEALVDQRKHLAQKVTRTRSATEIEVYTAGGFDLRERSHQGSGPLERTMAEYVAMIADGLSVRDAARLLAVSRATVLRRLHRRSLYGVRLRGVWLLPKFQFDGDRVVPGLDDILPTINPETHPVAVSRFFVAPQCDLVVAEMQGPASPREWLLMGHPPARVAALARGLALE
jgi:excisionase family DNA binding protein